MTHSLYISRVILGRKLQQYRIRAGRVVVAETARRLGMSESKLRKLEAGTNDSVKFPDIYAASYVYKLDDEETAHLLELCEAVDKPGWYHAYDVPSEFAHFLELERAATAIHIYEQEYVNGLFQTDAYLDGLRANRPGTKGGPDSGLRTDRQESVVNSDDPPQIDYATSEASLRRQVGGPATMRAQIRHLLEMDSRDHIAISVVPFSVGAHPSMDGSYWIMYFADRVFPTTVYLESLHGSHYEDADKIVRHYEAAFQATRQPPVTVPLKEFIDASNLLA